MSNVNLDHGETILTDISDHMISDHSDSVVIQHAILVQILHLFVSRSVLSAHKHQIPL